jgi:hypothetical protein
MIIRVIGKGIHYTSALAISIKVWQFIPHAWFLDILFLEVLLCEIILLSSSFRYAITYYYLVLFGCLSLSFCTFS